MKKFLSLLLTLLLLVSLLAGCAGGDVDSSVPLSDDAFANDSTAGDSGDQAQTGDKTPTSTAKDQGGKTTAQKTTTKKQQSSNASTVKGEKATNLGDYEITFFWGPAGEDAATGKYYKQIAEAGFTCIPLEQVSVEQAQKALGHIRKNGMKCSALADPRIRWLDYSKSYTQKEIDDLVSAIVNDYKDYQDVITGWYVYDEPNESRFDTIAKIIDAFHRFDPGCETYANLFPAWAQTVGALPGSKSYESYVANFIEKVKPDYVTYDLYHFYEEGSASYKGQGAHRRDYFSNMETIRTAAKKADKKYMIISQLIELQDLASATEEMLRWEVNMGLAYGTFRTSYFTFMLNTNQLDENRNNSWDKEYYWDEACINAETGEVYDHYYQVKEIATWLKPTGEVLANRKSTVVYHLKGEYESRIKMTKLEKGCIDYNTQASDTHKERIGDLSQNKDLVIGCFSDKSFMLVNKKYWKDGVNNVVLSKNVDKLQYFNPADSCWYSIKELSTATVKGDKVTLKLQPGAGILLRVK